ncbi:MAG: hypothetical protein ACYC6S_05780 [Desulfobulbia bacterium]
MEKTLFADLVQSLKEAKIIAKSKKAPASRLGSRAEIVGGLVLLGIGFKILHEHGVL